MLLRRAIAYRHPTLGIQVTDDRDFWGYSIPSFNSGRTKTVILQHSTSSCPETLSWVYDGQFDPIGAFNNSISAAWPPDDRDGDGGLEFIVQVDQSSFGSPTDTVYAVFRLGKTANSLVAVLSWPTTAPPTIPPQPMWTNNDHDNRHELEWISYGPWTASGPTTVSSILKMHWLSPGCMALDGTPPPGAKIWLAKQRDELLFRQDEPLADVIKRVHAE